MTAYACAREGLADMLRSTLLGGYDGAAAWTLVFDNIDNSAEQAMVELHESLHHELQTSTGWGFLGALALRLAQRGTRAIALSELFDVMVEGSQETHERFATALSASAIGLRQARALLQNNPTYLGFLDNGLRLAGQVPADAVGALLRCCMAPAVVPQMLSLGYRQLSRRDLDLARDTPDQRLAAFVRAGGPDSWAPVLAELAARLGSATAADDSELRLLESELLLRLCYQHSASVLASEGLATVAWDDLETVAVALKTAVEQVDPELAATLNLVTERSAVEHGLEFDRQKLRLRTRLPATVIGPDDTLRLHETFIQSTDQGEQYVQTLWLSRAAAVKQFAFADPASLPDPVIALVARSGDGVRVGLLPPGSTPRQAQTALGEVPIVVLTSHLSLSDDAVLGPLRRVEPVFAVMDLPVAWHVADWIRQGAEVRVALTPLGPAGAGRLWLAVFGVSRIPGMRFLCAGAETAVSMLVEGLRRRHPELLIDGALLHTHAAGLSLAVTSVLSLWHVLDQDAAD